MTDSTILECGHAPSAHSEFTTGYGIDADGKRYCYACCAERDRADMTATGRATLYLVDSKTQGGSAVTNWPGSLVFECGRVRVGRHNWAGKRYDVAFIGPDGHWWRGTQYGDMTQIAHCRRTKTRA